MDVSPRKRASILTLRENKEKTYGEISKIVGVSISTISRIMKMKKETGSVTPKRKGKCGRKRKTTPKDDAYLIRESVKDPRKTSDAIKTTLGEKGIEISSTVRRRLLEVGRKAYHPVKKQLLTKTMKTKRYKWGLKYKNWTKEDWRRVIFSDETHMFVQGQRNQHVRRSQNEKIRNAHIDQRVKHPQKKMFWGCFSFYGIGSLHPVEGMMRSQQYIEVVQRRVIPEMNRLFPDGSGVFQQDLAPCHTSKQVKKFMNENHIKLLECPRNSRDLHLIENLWSICKQRLRTMDCTSKEKLIQALIQVRYKYPQILKDCSKLVDSMPKRIKMLLNNRGGHIMY